MDLGCVGKQSISRLADLGLAPKQSISRLRDLGSKGKPSKRINLALQGFGLVRETINLRSGGRGSGRKTNNPQLKLFWGVPTTINFRPKRFCPFWSRTENNQPSAQPGLDKPAKNQSLELNFQGGQGNSHPEIMP